MFFMQFFDFCLQQKKTYLLTHRPKVIEMETKTDNAEEIIKLDNGDYAKVDKNTVWCGKLNNDGKMEGLWNMVRGGKIEI